MTSDQMIERFMRRVKNNATKYAKPHQGSKETKRRLRQVAYDRLPEAVVSPEARRAARKIGNWICLVLAVLLTVAPVKAQSVADSIDTAMAALVRAKSLLPIYTAPTDRLPRPKPALPTLGPAGSLIVDPTFGTQMLRVTDTTLGPRSWHVASNTHLNAWNADSTKFYVIDNGGQIVPFAYNGTTATPLQVRPYSQVEPTFSRIDPDILYTVGGPRVHTVRAYHFSTNTTTDVLDIETLQPNLTDTYIGGLLPGNKRLAIFYGGRGQDDHHFITIVGPDGRQSLDTLTLGFRLHSIAMDLSDRFVMLYPTNANPSQVIVWDTLSNTTRVPKNLYGHDALGFNTWVNMDSGSQAWDAAQWQFRELTALDVTRDLVIPILLPKEISMADHTSWNNARADKLMPVISATYTFQRITPWRAWDDEVIGLDLVGSNIWRFAHHRSDVRDETTGNAYFDYQPILNVSPDGKSVLVQTNWERTLGNDPVIAGRVRTDVLLMRLR